MTDQLLSLLKSKQPDLAEITSLVKDQPCLLYVDLDYLTGGSALHYAIKYDTKLKRKGQLTQLLMDLGADPNQSNSGGSLPLYWGLPHLNSMDWAAVELILACPTFDLHRPHGNRGSAWTVLDCEARDDPLLAGLHARLKASRQDGILGLMYCHCILSSV